MSLILLILFILFIYYIVFPLFKIGSYVHKTRKQMQGFYDQFNGKAAKNNTSRSQQQPRQTDKKIDPNVGEYVDFEEITDQPNNTQTTSTHADYAPSSPIEDAEWEDLN